LRGDELPAVSSLVDIGTAVSLNHLMPVGAHALDEVAQDVSLRFASGEETFIPFGSDTPESPAPGEVILAEGDVVLTRRWVWRQADHTLVVPGTKAVVFNIDALDGRSDAEFETIMDEVELLIHDHCGGTTTCAVLSAASPSVEISRTSSRS
jgi:DNA/RNA-binding domain of Phe-tRNA-synthetase-like protein